VTSINPTVPLTWFALALSVTPLLAHHSVAAEYDMSKTVTMQGNIIKVEWMNPHVRVWVETKNGDATASSWELELPPPNTLIRLREQSGQPNNTSRDFFKQGDQVSVTFWRAKDGSLLGYGLAMAFPDGRSMNFPTGWLFGGASPNQQPR
jgi:Family of unknown function (DUF6152)